MKILQRGHKPENRVYDFKCYYCSTTFEAERHECSFSEDQRDGSFLTYACPVCERPCTVATANHRR